MKILVRDKNSDLNSSIKQYVEKKAEHFTRFFDRIQKVEVTFDSARDGTYQAKVIVHLPRTKNIVCTESGANYTAAMDVAAHAVERRLTTYKEKLRHKGDRERVTRRLMKTGKTEEEPPR